MRGNDADEFDDIPATDFDDVTNQDQEDAIEGWTPPAAPPVGADDP
jgi:hypothetical protein